MQTLRLGLNIDHVATVRNARGGSHPDPVRAALLGEAAGADGITAHLREDRRHIRDADIMALKAQLRIPLNFEMAATEEMLAIALKAKPHACCLVPEKRAELTTEGGLDVASHLDWLPGYIAELKGAGIRVSLFIDPDVAQIEASRRAGADIVEFHTGTYCHAFESGSMQKELERLQLAAKLAAQAGLEPHAGHGLGFETVNAVAAIPELQELNIGHFLIGEAIFLGLEAAVKEMRRLMDNARTVL